MPIEPDFDRFVEPHEPHYFPAQARGFFLIREIERCLKIAESLDTGNIDPVTYDLVIVDGRDEDYHAALDDARRIAGMVARSNGYRILRGQGRSDEIAELVYEEHYLENQYADMPADAWWMLQD